MNYYSTVFEVRTRGVPTKENAVKFLFILCLLPAVSFAESFVLTSYGMSPWSGPNDNQQLSIDKQAQEICSSQNLGDAQQIGESRYFYRTGKVFVEATFECLEAPNAQGKVDCQECCKDFVWGHRICMKSCQQTNSCGF